MTPYTFIPLLICLLVSTSMQQAHAKSSIDIDQKAAWLLASCEAQISAKEPSALVLEKDADESLKTHHIFMQYLQRNYSKADIEFFLAQMLYYIDNWQENKKNIPNLSEALEYCRGQLFPLIHKRYGMEREQK